MNATSRRYGREIGRTSGAVLALGVGLSALLGACSSVPDALNPVEWVKGVEDLFEDDDAGSENARTAPAESAASAQAAAPYEPPEQVPGADKPIPSLAEVPERPRQQTISGGLVADTRGRRYADDPLPRQGEAVQPLPRPDGSMPRTEPPPPPAIAAAPAPAAAPATAIPPASPPAPAPAAVAATPPPAPTAPATVGDTFRQRLTDPVPRGAALGMPPANALVIGPQGPLNTVVVSSTGIEAVDTGPPVSAGGALFSEPSRFAQAAAIGLPPSGGSIKVATILFENGSAALKARDRRILREVSAFHRKRGGRVRVVGHASSRTRNMDAVRHKMVNFRISAQRADSVARELASLGVPADQITVAAHSDEEPVYYEVMPSGEAGNRRTEVFLDF